MKRALTFASIACLVIASTGCKPTAPPAAPALENTTTAEAEGIRLPNLPPKVGDTRTKIDDATMIVQLEAQPGRPVEVASVRHHEVREEVLTVDDGVVATLKASYGASTETRVMDGNRQVQESPVAGKTYVVWRDGGRLQATREDGSAPTAEELATVRKGHRDVGRANPMDQIVAAKVWRTGVLVDFTADELRQLNAATDPDAEDPIGLALALTLTRHDAELATFAMNTTLRIDSPKGSVVFDTTGWVLIERTTGRLREAFMRGPLEGHLGMPVTGTLEDKRVYTYSTSAPTSSMVPALVHPQIARARSATRP